MAKRFSLVAHNILCFPAPESPPKERNQHPFPTTKERADVEFDEQRKRERFFWRTILRQPRHLQP